MTTTKSQYRKVKEVKYDAETGYFGLVHSNGESSYIELGTMELDTDAMDMRMIHLGKRFVDISFENLINCNVIKSDTDTPRIECGVAIAGDYPRDEMETLGGKKHVPLWEDIGEFSKYRENKP